jgi:hypothetical protein
MHAWNGGGSNSEIDSRQNPEASVRETRIREGAHSPCSPKCFFVRPVGRVRVSLVGVFGVEGLGRAQARRRGELRE